ncbi:MAG: DEAD/DEAH box helicase [Alphaproteobacteria bacterium]|nr:MAG: DEAD/DEAH box helicase [Alphaproteobacteria bacterium]
MSFDTLGLSDKVVQAVQAAGYTTPTPIQAEAIPHILARRDVLGIAQTGTGKTASFVLPMLTRLEKGRARARMPRTLILEPTRELAAQVVEHFTGYGINHKLTVALLIGGVSFDEQHKKISRGADVLIATPGRLLDHTERGRLLLTGVEILVIDEADRMLDMGFIPDIERIVKLIPFTRQTLLFSATMPGEISRLANQFLQNPVRVEVSKPATAAENVALSLVSSGATPHEKRVTLRGLIDGAKALTNAIIFCNRKRDVATLYRSLQKHGYSVGSLHGDMDQHSRLKTLAAFRDNEITLLVASDVAARGLDIPNVSHIFNFDVPTHAEDYVHRIGRTGRAGRSGEAVTIVTRAEGKYIDAIERLIGKTIARTGEVPAETAPPEAREEGGEAGRSRRRPDRQDKGRESRGSRRRGRKSAAKTSDGETARQTDAPKTDEMEAAKPPRDRNGRDRARSDAAGGQRGGGKKRQREDAAVGFKDHVPAFLLRPVRTE